MLELGEFAEAAHRSLGALVAQRSVDALFCCGALSEFIVEGAKKVRACFRNVFSDPQSEALGDLLKAYVITGDTLLVKGSRGSKMERSIESLKRHQEG